ncbi:MAG: ribosomal-processing cysteine protease Prp [Tissierellia bacterium]|nr:ribosomal-processing cysteine protease Prp [Tissierellia bacterium]
MIDVTVFRNNRNAFLGFEIKGHADYDEYGKDIVCAGVSTLATAIINTLDYYHKKSQFIFTDQQGIMKLEITNNNNTTDILMRTFILGIENIEKNFKEYVKLHFEEV